MNTDNKYVPSKKQYPPAIILSGADHERRHNQPVTDYEEVGERPRVNRYREVSTTAVLDYSMLVI